MDYMEDNMSDSSTSSPPDTAPMQAQAPKRTAADAGLKPNGMRPPKSVKRRASKACQCCRARKVRCNVVEHGAPCTNCRLDEVECIVSESKRKKKWTTDETSTSSNSNTMKPAPNVPLSAHPPYEPLRRTSEHVPHALYQDLNKEASMPSASPRPTNLFTPSMFTYNVPRMNPRSASIVSSLISPAATPPPMLPAYIRPLPARFGPDDVTYLQNKGALTIPNIEFRDELLRCYAEFVHPYMPLLDLHELVATIDQNSGAQPISLLLFQAVMFAGIATVDMRHLRAAGYTHRRDARRQFFNKTRLLYDFDYEVDRIPLIQSLLLMTYWYETPDDQKDSHHWMGIAVSLSHTIGLHRNPEKSTSMEPARQKLWKRIWWSTYMRDRLIALGMRRPTRIKDSDFDVPMLKLEDFNISALPDGPSCMSAPCTIMRDIEKQRQMAIMCVQKAKLCICISNVLSVQYSVPHNNHGAVSSEGTTKTTMMLVAKKMEAGVDQVLSCDQELHRWKEQLPEEAQYVVPTHQDIEAGDDSMALNRSLLHMIYYATLSALHRPQVLPSTGEPLQNTNAEAIERSRKAVRLAAAEITSLANTLYTLKLVRFLPTTGITVLLPAIIIHLLDIKAQDETTRQASLQGFCQCMQIMARLRDIYAAADYSTAFLEAAIRKAEITLPQKSDEVKEPRNVITSSQGLLDAGRRLHLSHPGSAQLTPPPDSHQTKHSDPTTSLTDADIARRLSTYLASTPPPNPHDPNNLSSSIDPSLLDPSFSPTHSHSHSHSSNSHDFYPSNHFPDGALMMPNTEAFEPDFDSMINLDAAGVGEGFGLDESSWGAMQGESSGFALDVEWMKGMEMGAGVGGAAGGGEKGEVDDVGDFKMG